ncbi:hypothetical protein B0H11DRAFT_1926237 [Mycena galericulata]|nr:hypothetical protein B0H11DRAFT_1926237 [Mycena galericulata]
MAGKSLSVATFSHLESSDSATVLLLIYSRFSVIDCKLYGGNIKVVIQGTLLHCTTYFSECNNVWQYRTNLYGTIPARRPSIDHGDGLLRRREFDLHVLHPASFLPNGEPLPVCVDPPYLDEQHPTVDATPTWEVYRYDPATSKLVRAADNTTPLTITIRHGDLSTVAVVLNADAKIENAQKSGWVLSSDVVRLKQAIDSFKLELYHLPTLNGESSWRTVPDISNTAGVRSTPKPPNRDDHTDMLQVGEERGEEDYDSDYEDEDEELEEESDEEASRTLTPEEYDLALKKVVDPTVPIQERIQIGALLLTKRCVPLPPHVADQEK